MIGNVLIRSGASRHLPCRVLSSYYYCICDLHEESTRTCSKKAELSETHKTKILVEAPELKPATLQLYV